MRSKWLVLLILACCAVAWPAEDKFKLKDSAELERTTPVTVDVDYTGTLPPAPNPYLTESSWKVFWSSEPGSPIHVSDVVKIESDVTSQKIRLHITGNAPLAGASWTVLFNTTGPPYLIPQVIPVAFKNQSSATEAQQPAPANPSAIQGNQAATSAGPAVNVPLKKSCDNKMQKDKPAFCPVNAKETPDISVTASFLAAGGTKPIYALSLKGTLQGTSHPLGFHPGVSTDIEINQNVKPPVNSTAFDPDSIVAGLAFTHFKAILYKDPLQDGQKYKDHMFLGVNFKLGLPNGEFSKSDPSSNIVFNPAARFVLNSWQPKSLPSLFATLYPFLALELGENLSKPASIQKVPVNLSHYNAITRGVLGTDAVLATATPDGKGNMVNSFSLTGTYRVRLPAFDEPEVRTIHQVTTVDLSTKARHWVEADINYAPWSFKYLTVTAKYQYGELPPLFKLVDHSFTLGLTLQASQTSKTK